jgi:hypothetical protein
MDKRLLDWLKSNYIWNEDCHNTSVFKIEQNGVYFYDKSYDILFIIYRKTGTFTTLTAGMDEITITNATYTEPANYIDGDEIPEENVTNHEIYKCSNMTEAIRLFNKLSLQSLPVPND